MFMKCDQESGGFNKSFSLISGIYGLYDMGQSKDEENNYTSQFPVICTDCEFGYGPSENFSSCIGE